MLLRNEMKIIHTIDELRQWRNQVNSVAFVPTMGNLHCGHLALVAEAKKQAQYTVVSIFVNRLQFGQGEDFDLYPRTLQADSEKLISAGVDVLFVPDEQELYPRVIQEYNVEPPHLQNELCGCFRPGHFRGVVTVVNKLFNIVQPDVACFGKKDYQQLIMIRRMVEDLNIPVKIVAVDTGRAEDGLALSSRNGYLSPSERLQAPELYQSLCFIAEQIRLGRTDYAVLEKIVIDQLNQSGWQVDYVDIRHADDLQVAKLGDTHLVILAAARIGKTRLIDNIELTLSE